VKEYIHHQKSKDKGKI